MTQTWELSLGNWWEKWFCVKLTTNLSFYDHYTPWQTTCQPEKLQALADDIWTYATKRQMEHG